MAELHPDPDLVEQHRVKMAAKLGPSRTKAGFDSYVAGFMDEWTIATARAHGAECTLTNCGTCSYLVHALSLYAAYSIEFPPDPETMKRLFGT